MTPKLMYFEPKILPFKNMCKIKVSLPFKKFKSTIFNIDNLVIHFYKILLTN